MTNKITINTGYTVYTVYKLKMDINGNSRYEIEMSDFINYKESKKLISDILGCRTLKNGNVSIQSSQLEKDLGILDEAFKQLKK